MRVDAKDSKVLWKYLVYENITIYVQKGTIRRTYLDMPTLHFLYAWRTLSLDPPPPSRMTPNVAMLFNYVFAIQCT